MKVLTLALLLVASASASPLARNRLERRTSLVVTTADITAFSLYAEYAGAAYCNSKATVGTVMSCANDVCQTATANGAVIVATLGSAAPDSETDMEGYVAYDPAAHAVIIAYRGSNSIRNYIVDMDTLPAPCSTYLSAALATEIEKDKGSQNCLLHRGFGRAWASLRDETFAALTAAQAAAATSANGTASSAPGPAAVIVTGHSLGGAVATLAAAELRAKGIACDLYSYGSPRVGNAVLANYLSAQGPVGTTSANGLAHYRVTHLDDPVPQLPPLWMDFAHTSPEFWLADGGTTTTGTGGSIVYQPANVNVCVGFANTSCNAGAPSVDIVAHLSYFEPISGCAPFKISFKSKKRVADGAGLYDENDATDRVAKMLLMDEPARRNDMKVARRSQH
ncbi:Lipase, class 3 [Niveomyces insectorum RCEF 264]|uniref:Lipase, class 3 n=1 Tax=Niveomyces insectorum RCEF 264 TaxID=1081102 RepID=A0A167MFW6_9HYPO|nr:Lipase, class 3 [Niveomyces insectorum RCEF 264]